MLPGSIPGVFWRVKTTTNSIPSISSVFWISPWTLKTRPELILPRLSQSTLWLKNPQKFLRLLPFCVSSHNYHVSSPVGTNCQMHGIVYRDYWSALVILKKNLRNSTRYGTRHIRLRSEFNSLNCKNYVWQQLVGGCCQTCFYGIKSSSNKHRSQLNPLAVPLNDAVIPLLMMLFVKELELVPYFKPVSVTMPVETEYQSDSFDPVWLIFIAPSVVTVAVGSSPPSPPTDGSQLE